MIVSVDSRNDLDGYTHDYAIPANYDHIGQRRVLSLSQQAQSKFSSLEDNSLNKLIDDAVTRGVLGAIE